MQEDEHRLESRNQSERELERQLETDSEGSVCLTKEPGLLSGGCGGKLLMGFMWGQDLVPFADGTGCMEVMTETKQEANRKISLEALAWGGKFSRVFVF